MNDDELIIAVRDAFTGVHSSTPVEQILSRSRRVRFRWQISGLAGVLAAAAAAAVAVILLLPASQQTTRPPSTQLAAWAIARQTDGSISVTIFEPRDQADLQSRLRAVGIPASVIFNRHQPNPCQPYGHGGDLRLLRRAVALAAPPGPSWGHAITMTIHPSALPSGAGIQISTGRSGVGVHLVMTSQLCTGS
jgi:hypothetical protein